MDSEETTVTSDKPTGEETQVAENAIGETNSGTVTLESLNERITDISVKLASMILHLDHLLQAVEASLLAAIGDDSDDE